MVLVRSVFVILCINVLITKMANSSACPLNCECMDNSTWVKCQYSWSKVPELQKNVNHLDISRNHLGPRMSHEFFEYSDLEFLDLSYNGIENITERSLRGLTKLKLLNLSNNNIRFLPNNLFCDNEHLQMLDLSHNLFSTLPDVIFRSLDNLLHFRISNNKLTQLKLGPRWQIATKIKTVDLSNNRFENITSDAFEFTSYWDWTVKRSLNLKNCGIKHISNGTLSAFKGLHELNLSENPRIGKEHLRILLLELEQTNLKRLDLSGLGLYQIQPLFENVDELSLEYLNLANNFFRDIPNFAVGNIRSLQYLNLSNNYLTSEIPGLSDLSNLVSLDLSFNQLTQFQQEISNNMPKLKFLDLSYNDIEEASNVHLGPLSLKILNISSNNLDNLVLPGNTTEVEVLNFAQNRITELFPLQNIPNLVYFDVSSNMITSLGSFLFAQTYDFHTANFSNNKLMEIDHRCFLPSTPNVIDLSYNKLKEVKFASWTYATEIYLQHNQITEVSYHAFYGMSSLTILDLSYNNIANIPDLAFQYLVDLQRLSLGHNSLSIKAEDFPKLLHSLKSLQDLDLSNNKLNNLNKTVFSKSPNIQKLSLAYNQFPFIPVAAIAGLEKLIHLDISGNPYLCDCGLLPLRDWIKENTLTKLASSYNVSSTTCAEPPHLQGLPVVEFQEERFQCRAEIFFVILFGSIGGALIVIGIVGTLMYRCYKKWRITHPKKEKKPKEKKKSVGFSKEKEEIVKEFLEKQHRYGNGVPPNATKDMKRPVQLPNERLPHYRAGKYNGPLYPSMNASHWRYQHRSRNIHRVQPMNPHMFFPDQQIRYWKSPGLRNHSSYPPLPSAYTLPIVKHTTKPVEQSVRVERPRRASVSIGDHLKTDWV